MPYQINPAQFKNVIALPAKERYDHFMSKICDWEELWSLKNKDGFVTYGDNEGNEGIPFWPHPDYSSAVAKGIWEDCNPEGIDLENFTNKWLPGMKEDSTMAVVFPTPDEKGIMVKPEDLLADIQQECSQYE